MGSWLDDPQDHDEVAEDQGHDDSTADAKEQQEQSAPANEEAADSWLGAGGVEPETEGDGRVPPVVATGAGREPAKPAWQRFAPIIAVCAALLVLAGIATVIGMAASNMLGGDDEEPLTDATGASSSQPTSPVETTAPADDDPNKICDSSGDRSTPRGTVIAFQQRYYGDRDPAKVNELLAPGTELDTDELRRAFDSMPDDAGFCVEIGSESEGTVVATATQTGAEKTTFAPQRYEMEPDEEGQWQITSITSGQEA